MDNTNERFVISIDEVTQNIAIDVTTGSSGTNNYNDLINKPDLSQYATDIDLVSKADKSYVDFQDTAIKNTIAAKADKTYVDTGLAGKVDDAQVLTNVPAGAVFTDTVYDDTQIKSDIAGKADVSALDTKVDKVVGKELSDNNFTDAQVTKLTNAESVTGAQTKADTAQSNAQTYTDNVAANKVDKVAGKGLSEANYTQSEKDKLAGLESGKFKGTFVSSTALTTAHPSPEEGAYAHVDGGVGTSVLLYIWDANDAAWSPSYAESAEITAAQVKTKYESNPDTNAYSDAEKTKVGSLPTNVESVEGAQSKADAAETAANSYTDTTVSGYLPTTGGILSGDLIPDVDNVHALGSPTKMWKDVYIGPGSLYINGTKVIEEVSDTINIRADINQNLAIKTSGIGNLELVSIDGLIQLKGGLMLSGGKLIRTTDGTAFLFDDSIKLSAGESVISDNVTKIDGTPFITGLTWEQLTGKPATFTPSAHTHTEYAAVDHTHTGYATTADLEGKVDDSQVLTNVPAGAVFTDTVYDDTALQNAVAGKADANHTHPEYLTELPVHNHDTDYYKKTEVDTALSGKVDDSQVLTNVPAGAVFTDTVYDDTAIQSAVAGKADATHNHTVSEITDFPTIPDSTSDLTNDSGYITAAEVPEDTTKLDKQTNIQGLWRGTQAQYDAIATPDANTVYFIEE